MLERIKKWWNKPVSDVDDALEYAFRAGVKEEREACADIAEKTPIKIGRDVIWCDVVADAIRARSNV